MSITVTPTTPEFFAEISNIDSARPLLPADRAAIEDAINRYAVVVFRGQKLSDAQQIEFSAHFGPIHSSAQRARHTGIKHRLVAEAMRIFFEVRDVPGLKKKPSTSELLDWLKLLVNEDMSPEMLRERDPRKLIPPLHGALLKNEQDVHLFERLAFLNRREV